MPTIDIPDRICPHCGGIRWIVYKRVKTLVSGKKKIVPGYKCSVQNMEGSKKWKEKNKEHYNKTKREAVKLQRLNSLQFRLKDRAKAKAYYQANKECRNSYRRKWALENPDKEKQYARKSNKKQRDNLSDYYVSRAIVGRDKSIKSKDLSPDLVELKRKQLLLTRQIKAHVKNNQD